METKKVIRIGFYVMVMVFVGGMGLIAGRAFAQSDTNKVPDQFAVRLLKLKLDESGLNTQMVQLQAQYNQIQQTIQHDEGEIASITTEALTASKKDNTWTIDYNKLEFIAKPVPTDPKKAGK